MGPCYLLLHLCLGRKEVASLQGQGCAGGRLLEEGNACCLRGWSDSSCWWKLFLRVASKSWSEAYSHLCQTGVSLCGLVMGMIIVGALGFFFFFFLVHSEGSGNMKWAYVLWSGWLGFEFFSFAHYISTNKKLRPSLFPLWRTGVLILLAQGCGVKKQSAAHLAGGG